MKYQKVLKRRTLLRGAGTVAIALPFLDEMRSTSVYAADPEPPARAINVFFGLGVPKEIAAEGLGECLSPLQRHAAKLAIVRGVNIFEADGAENNHFDGSGGVFTGIEPTNVSQANGPSIDQVIRAEKYPGGVGNDTLISTLMMGSFFRRKLDNNFSLTRYVNCWNDDGTPVDVPIETAGDLFDRVFGMAVPPGPGDLKDAHYDRSVLDSVVSQYERYTSEAGGLGASSRSRVADHLDKIRELEKKLFPNGTLSCEPPAEPGTLPLLNGQEVDAGGGGPTVAVDDWVAYWQAMVDVYALALQCDVTRFGQVLFQSAGERVHLDGTWDFNGTQVTFDDLNDPIGSGGTHEYWHSYNASNPNTLMRWHTHFIMEQLAYFLDKIDDPAYLDENGLTILDNALITISTELGNGSAHNLESVFHAVSQANQRIAPGIYDVNASATDLYRTVLQSMDINRAMGTESAFNGILNQILV